MRHLIVLEFKKLLRQRKSLTGIFAIFILNALFALGFLLRSAKSGDQPSEIDGSYLVSDFLNAMVYTQTILVPCTFIIFPMVLAIIGAHMLAGELENGTLRLVLVRPVSRSAIMVAKITALSAYAAMMILALLVSSYVVSRLLLGPGEVSVVVGPMVGIPKEMGTVFILTPEQAYSRLFLSYLLSLPMQVAVCCLTMMMSVLTRHFTSAAVLTTMVYFSSYIIGIIPFLSALDRYLPSRHWSFWKYALLPKIPWDQIALHGLWTFLYCLAFYLIGLAAFRHKDL